MQPLLNEDLLLAVQAADVKAAERALKNGADENTRDRHGETVLHLAVEMNQPEKDSSSYFFVQ